MSALWTVEELLGATNGRPLGNLPEEISGISIDSRSLNKGDAFFAIKGDRVDGHDFASAAMAAGAGLLVVAEEKLPALGRLAMPMIVVSDVLAALAAVGVAARKRSKAKVIAVTGSAGKTTTKEALRLALSPSGKVHASDRSYNNHWGVPLSLARLPAGALVINVGRGPLVDTDALTRALERGHLGGAGLDVSEPEPLPPEHRLWTLDSVVVTPHMGGASDQVWARRMELVQDNVRAFTSGAPLRNVVDKERGY